jgi:hypothetical protein
MLSKSGGPRPVQASAPQPTDFTISRILMNAESMIASMTGLKTQEVQVSVNLARYDF